VAEEQVIIGVRRRRSTDRSHRHVFEVVTDSGDRFRLLKVIDSLYRGEPWVVRIGEFEAPVTVVPFCPARECLQSPYVRTVGKWAKWASVELLDDC
jgi:hypothetical protein